MPETDPARRSRRRRIRTIAARLAAVLFGATGALAWRALHAPTPIIAAFANLLSGPPDRAARKLRRLPLLAKEA